MQENLCQSNQRITSEEDIAKILTIALSPHSVLAKTTPTGISPSNCLATRKRLLIDIMCCHLINNKFSHINICREV